MGTFVREAKLGKTQAHRGTTSDQAVYFLANVSGVVVLPGGATFSNAYTPDIKWLRHKLQNYGLPCVQELAHVPIRSSAIYQQRKTLPRPDHFVTDDNFPETLGKFFTSGFYALDTPVIPAVDPSPSFHPASTVHPCTCEMAAVESTAEVFFGVFTEDDLNAKEVAVRDFKQQSCTP